MIRRLRDLSMPLDDIAAVLSAPDVTSRNAAISAHLHRMEAQLTQTRAVVTSLRGLLTTDPVAVPVEFVTVPGTPALAIEAVIDDDDVWAWRNDAFAQMRMMLDNHPTWRRGGPDAAVYSTELFETERGTITALLPLSDDPGLAVNVAGVLDGTRIRMVEVAATEYAVAWHHGGLDDLDLTFSALGGEVAKRAIGLTGHIREEYPVSLLDNPDPQTWITGVHWPVFQTTGAQTPN